MRRVQHVTDHWQWCCHVPLGYAMKAPLLVKPPEDIGEVVQKSLQQFRGREVVLKEVLGYALRLLSDYKKFDSVASKDVQRE